MRIPTTPTQIKFKNRPSATNMTIPDWPKRLFDAANVEALKYAIEETAEDDSYTGKELVDEYHAVIKEEYKDNPRWSLPTDNPMDYFTDMVKCLKAYLAVKESIAHVINLKHTRDESGVAQLHRLVRDSRNRLLDMLFFEEFHGYHYLRSLWEDLKPLFNEEKQYSVERMFRAQDTIASIVTMDMSLSALDANRLTSPELIGIRDTLLKRLAKRLPKGIDFSALS